MQIMGNGPLHCDALMHRSPAACAGAPTLTSALNATMATNNNDVPALNMIRSPLFSAVKCVAWIFPARRLDQSLLDQSLRVARAQPPKVA
jgi:hypothetical protein